MNNGIAQHLNMAVKLLLMQNSSTWKSSPSLFTGNTLMRLLKHADIFPGTKPESDVGRIDLEEAVQPHLPVEDHRVLAVGGGGGVGVGGLCRHGLDGDETQGAGVIFVGV